jgi:hypothetical protein
MDPDNVNILQEVKDIDCFQFEVFIMKDGCFILTFCLKE